MESSSLLSEKAIKSLLNEGAIPEGWGSGTSLRITYQNLVEICDVGKELGLLLKQIRGSLSLLVGFDLTLNPFLTSKNFLRSVERFKTKKDFNLSAPVSEFYHVEGNLSLGPLCNEFGINLHHLDGTKIFEQKLDLNLLTN